MHRAVFLFKNAKEIKCSLVEERLLCSLLLVFPCMLLSCYWWLNLVSLTLCALRWELFSFIFLVAQIVFSTIALACVFLAWHREVKAVRCRRRCAARTSDNEANPRARPHHIRKLFSGLHNLTARRWPVAGWVEWWSRETVPSPRRLFAENGSWRHYATTLCALEH